MAINIRRLCLYDGVEAWGWVWIPATDIVKNHFTMLELNKAVSQKEAKKLIKEGFYSFRKYSVAISGILAQAIL